MEVFERIKEIRKAYFNDSNLDFASFMGEKPPTNRMADEKVKSNAGDLKISYIDFEVAVSASSEIETNDTRRKGIEVSGSVLGLRIGGKIGNENNCEGNKQASENISRIKFSIPIVYPTKFVGERHSTIKSHLSEV